MNTNDQDNVNDLNNLRGMAVLDKEHDKIGTLEDVYIDEQNGKPAFATIDTGGFFSSKKFIPIQMLHLEQDVMVADADENKIKDAPSIDADDIINTDQERRLYEYYGLNYEHREGNEQTENKDMPDTGQTGDMQDGDDSMSSQSHETETPKTEQTTEHIRFKRYIVTEQVTTTLPDNREEIHIIREPINEQEQGQIRDSIELGKSEPESAKHEDSTMERTDRMGDSRTDSDK